MTTRPLSSYLDLVTQAPGANNRPHVGPVHTRLVSAEAMAMDMHWMLLEGDPAMRGGIVLNVGGHVGYGLAARLGAQAVINIDQNILQGVHHKVFAEAMARTDASALGEGVMPSIGGTVSALWEKELDSQPLEGAAVGHHCFTCYRGPNHYPGLSEAVVKDEMMQGVMGLDKAGQAHTRSLARAGRIYAVVANLGDAHHVRQVENFVNTVAADLQSLNNGIRTVPTVMYAANAVDYEECGYDFCGNVFDDKRARTVVWAVHDITFGFHGRNKGALISTTAEEGYVKLLSQSRMQGFLAEELKL